MQHLLGRLGLETTLALFLGFDRPLLQPTTRFGSVGVCCIFIAIIDLLLNHEHLIGFTGTPSPTRLHVHVDRLDYDGRRGLLSAVSWAQRALLGGGNIGCKVRGCLKMLLAGLVIVALGVIGLGHWGLANAYDKEVRFASWLLIVAQRRDCKGILYLVSSINVLLLLVFCAQILLFERLLEHIL